MYITEATKDQLNELLAACFQMNSICDNIAYEMAFKKMVHAEPIFHEKYAHAFPALADVISELMLKLNARPIRKALHENTDEYQDIIEMFSSLLIEVDRFRELIIKTIEVSDLNNDAEVRIAMENFLVDFIPFVDQANTWKIKAEICGANIEMFDHDFDDFTNM